MDDASLRRRLLASLEHMLRQLATHGKHGELYERDGMLAAIVRGAPESSIVNAALPLDDRPLDEQAVASVKRAYTEAGLGKWGVWMDPARHATDALRAHGLVLDSTPAPMGAELARLDLDDAPPAQAADAATVARVNDLAYGHPDDRLARAFGAFPATVARGYRADGADGEPVAALMVSDHERDAAVWFVATAPWAQRQGHATRLLKTALKDARERGCATTTLQSSAAGRPVYERVGYRALGELHLWEHRQ